MAEPGTLHDAFIDELRDAYDAEKQLLKALPKMAKAATSPELSQAFLTHRDETQGQIDRLEQVFASLDEKVRGKHCDGIAGIIEEGKSAMEEDFDETTMDAVLIASGQRAEHYEINPFARVIIETTGLPVRRVLSGPLGGDLQIGALIAEGRVRGVIFLRDPLQPHPHEPDITALMKVCDTHNVPLATNLATAEMLLDNLCPLPS